MVRPVPRISHLLLTALLGVALEAIRDQVMRHDPYTGVFNGAYNNESVRFNVQNAYLSGEISEDGLTRVFTHMSIRCNAGAPTYWGCLPHTLQQAPSGPPCRSRLLPRTCLLQNRANPHTIRPISIAKFEISYEYLPASFYSSNGRL